MRRQRILVMGATLALALLVAAHFAMRDGGVERTRSEVPWNEPKVERDLVTIGSDTLRVIVLADPLTYEQRPKAVSGLEYELLQRFARSHDLHLEVLPMDHPDSMLLALQQGRGDIIAAQWPPRSDRRKWVEFTIPYRTVYPTLAVLRGDPLAKRSAEPESGAVVDQAIDTAWITGWSPFSDPDYRFEGHAVRTIQMHADPFISPDDLMMELVMGRHDAMITTDARSSHEAARFPVLEFTALRGPGQPLCFALRRNSPELLGALNEWLADPLEIEARELFFRAYVGRMPKPGPLRVRKGVPVVGDSISPFDHHFRIHANDMPWDWELLAAMAYKESRFDSTVTSHMGAMGIMQLMPRTAQRLGVDPELGMQDHIRAATRYINKLDTMWMRAIPDREVRLRFVLASYNAGPGHIIDAQRLAEQLGLDPKKWEHNVERAVLLLAKPRYYTRAGMRNGYCQGSQVFHYVRDVVSMYRQLKGRPRQEADPSKLTVSLD